VADKKARQTVSDYVFFHEIETRWKDNDIYGHVNNVEYYSYFDTAVAAFLVSRLGLYFKSSPVIAYVIETGCTYFEPVSFPDRLKVGVRIIKLGNSSVRYELAIFKSDGQHACAQGHFVHVYVDRSNQKPASIPEDVRQAMQSIVIAPMASMSQ
jgi:acyl-CoA thioester hydrolase